MRYSSQSGSAIIWAMIGVALIAAIGVAFMNSTRTSSSVISDERAKVYANQIIAFGNDVKTAVNRLRLRGCSDADISFENDIIDGYTNTNNPPDSCKVFHSSGGSLHFLRMPGPYALEDEMFYEGKYAFINATEWQGNGTTCGADECVDIIMVAGPLDAELCNAINEHLGYATLPTEAGTGGGQFTGTYQATHGVLGDVSTSEVVAGKSAACIFKSDTERYVYYHLILSR